MTTADPRSRYDLGPTADTSAIWTRLLVASVLVVAAYDLVFMVFMGELIPPLVAGVGLTLLGVGLLARSRRSGAVVLGMASGLLVVAVLPFAAAQLPHPASPIDFTHAVVGLLGRVAAVLAAIGVWRETSARVGRRVTTLVIAVFASSLVVTGVAVTTTQPDAEGEGDPTAVIVDAAFPVERAVAAGVSSHLDTRGAAARGVGSHTMVLVLAPWARHTVGSTVPERAGPSGRARRGQAGPVLEGTPVVR